MKQLYAILLMLLVSVSALGANAYNVNQYNHLARLSTEELMHRGQDFLQNKGWADSAIVCYSIVANRAHGDNQEKKEMYQVARALNNLGYIYATYYYDYHKAYENLNQSMELSKRYGYDNNLAYAYLNMASIINSRNSLYAGETFSSDALDNTRQAFDVAVKAQEWNVAVTSIYNMLEMMRNKSDIKLIEPDLVRFKKLQLTDSVEMWQCTRLFCQATEAYFSGQYAKALEYYGQMEIKAQEVTTNRQQCIIKAMQQKAIVLSAMHRYQEAINCLQQVEEITLKQGMQSELIDTYRFLTQVYSAMGNRLEADHFNYKYLKAKDELIHKSHAEKLEKSRFLDEMRRVNEQVEQIQAKHERTHQLLLMMSLIAAIILIALVLLVRSNIKQRSYIRHLYEKNVQLLDVKVTDTGLAAQPGGEQEESAPKYQGLLDQESKDRLFDQIKRVMDDMSIICKPDFSLQQLADQVAVIISTFPKC
jgi:tetratricopeptide (TPR) repeat protein